MPSPIGVGTNFGVILGSVTIEFTNVAGNATRARCATADIPSGSSGYAVGCLLTDTTTGLLYLNSGTTSSSLFELANGGTVAVSVTAAEILALDTVPKILIAAPGSGKIALIDSAVIVTNAGSSPFTVGGDMKIYYTEAEGAGINILDGIYSSAALIATTSSPYYFATRGATTTPAVGDVVAVANSGVELGFFNGTGASGAGNGTMKVYLTYRILTL